MDFAYEDYGVFINEHFKPVTGRSYKVNVKLESGDEYESEPDTLFPIVPIDRIWFERDQEVSQLNFYIDFKDDGSRKDYYRWRYKNTYEFVAPIAMELSKTKQRMENSICISWVTIQPPLAEEIARCWVDLYDNQYLKIGEDDLFNGKQMTDFYAFSIPLSRHFDRGFFVSARQLSLSESAFKYWDAIQSQINNKGTIFEKTNYQIKGNIKSLSNQDEVVLGFFGVSSAETRSIFIGDYMGLWGDVCCNCSASCPPASCFDCRRVGAYASNAKPDFWP